MTLPQKHRRDTKALINALSNKDIANWLLNDGYFPEQYVLPPCFSVRKFSYRTNPYFKGTKPKIPIENLLEVQFPKSSLTEGTYGVINHKIYHDITWHLLDNWSEVLKKLFNPQNRIYSYSFPIPLNNKNKGSLGNLRSGRMIYEFIEMAEKDLVAEAYQYKLLVKSDIKNFYPSIYTHAIAWAFEQKLAARKDRYKRKLLGNKIDKLFQNANDGCTNGLPIGPAASDLVAEIMLARIDTRISYILRKKNIKFTAVRFKDDYRFLCNNKDDAREILVAIQTALGEYNLKVSEEKSEVYDLPNGLFRGWIKEYQGLSLRSMPSISYKKFETTYLQVVSIHERHPNSGVIDKFLSELISRNHRLKLRLNDEKQISKVFSLIWLLTDFRPRALPQVLAILELIIINPRTKKASAVKIFKRLNEILNNKFKNERLYIYELIWVSYFLKSHNRLVVKWPNLIKSKLLNSIKLNQQEFDNKTRFCELFDKIKNPGSNILLAKHLAIFPKEEEE